MLRVMHHKKSCEMIKRCELIKRWEMNVERVTNLITVHLDNLSNYQGMFAIVILVVFWWMKLWSGMWMRKCESSLEMMVVFVKCVKIVNEVVL